MNDITSKTLLLLFTLSILGMNSCSVTSNSYSDYTQNKVYKPTSKKGKTYSHSSRSTRSKTSTNKSRSKTSGSSRSHSSATRSEVSFERQNLVNYAKTLEGTTYLYGGKSEMGFDCSGFTSHVYRKQGKSLLGNSNTQAKQGKRISISQAKVGDLIFFGSTQKISHVAIIAERTPQKLVIVHASSSKGVITQDITNSAYWTPKILYAVDVISDKSPSSKRSYSRK